MSTAFGTEADPPAAVARELAQLGSAIDRQVGEIMAALADWASAGGQDDATVHLAEHRELVRQLGALRDRVARARSQIGDRRELHAELATLLSFARTLAADAESLRARLYGEEEERERLQAQAGLERERVAAQRLQVLRRRDALQASIVQTAEGIAGGDRSQCRRTVPVVALDHGVTVCSIGVATPRRRFRSARFWLVTLTDTRDGVLARPT